VTIATYSSANTCAYKVTKPDTITSTPNLTPNPDPITKQHAVVNIRLIVPCHVSRQIYTRHVVEPSVLL